MMITLELRIWILKHEYRYSQGIDVFFFHVPSLILSFLENFAQKLKCTENISLHMNIKHSFHTLKNLLICTLTLRFSLIISEVPIFLKL